MILTEPELTGVKDFRNKLVRHSSKIFRNRRLEDISSITIHHSLTKSGSAESFARYHVNKNNWPGIGYHFIVEKSGVVKWCNSLVVSSYCVDNSDKYAIGICLIGDFRTQKLAGKQLKSVLNLLRQLIRHFSFSVNDIKGHSSYRGYEQKECPCIDMHVLRNQVSNKNKSIEKRFINPIEEDEGVHSKQKMMNLIMNPNKLLMKPGDSVFDLVQSGKLFDVGEVLSKNKGKCVSIKKPVKETTEVKLSREPEVIPNKVKKMLKVLNNYGYEVFEDNGKPFKLNIVGVRNSDGTVNSFDDELCVFWKYEHIWTIKQYKITTDPGLTYLTDPLNTKGTAILKEGQYRGAYKLGRHRNRYAALVQVKPVTVIRDFNRDNVLDYKSGKEQTGLFGINIHRSNSSGESVFVNKWSAGCQVFANSMDYAEFIGICKKAIGYWDNSFTYTLINNSVFVKNI